ncbi:MAG: hypothetical protein GWP59_03215 [Chlamydiales bacterium]|nr:hypothetical protein [Chlamydiales bacterium]NCF70695.1 hypothetical protein [Chlamydiales bacterium]
MINIDAVTPVQNANLDAGEVRLVRALLNSAGVKGISPHELPELVKGVISPEGITKNFQATVQGLKTNFSAKKLHFSTLSEQFDSGKLNISFSVPVSLRSITPNKIYEARNIALYKLRQFGFNEVEVKTKKDTDFKTRVILQLDTRAKI